MKTDLRVIKSRTAIENSFINLVEMKGFQSISIKEIAEKALVNRNTIYLNYGSKEGILEAIVTESFQKYFGNLSEENFKNFGVNKKKVEEIFKNLFNVINENIELYRILLTDHSSTGYIETEANKLRKFIVSIFKPTLKNEVSFQFILSGVWGVISTYIIYAKGTEEEYIKYLTELALSNLKHLSYSK